MDKDDWYFIFILLLIFLIGQGIISLEKIVLDAVLK